MDMSGLLSMLKWIGAIFPIFNIEFPFHIAYDIIIRLASSWILEDSVGEIADFFNSAFGSAIQYMYDPDQTFLKMCLDMWSSTSKFALALLPLMLILSIFSTVKYGGERSSLTLVKTRELAFGTIFNVGLAASSYWIFTKVLAISTALGKQMLAISGITVTTNFSEIAERIFLPSMITHLDGSSEALLVVLMFLRLFLTLVLFISIVLVSVSTRIGILLLFGISPVCFVLSVYEEFDWIRDSWIKTFIGFILTPVFDGILLALIMLNNEKFVSSMSMGEVFRTLCISIGISCMIVVLHSEVIKKIFDSLIADIKKAVRAIKIAAQVIARIALAISSGGTSTAAEAAAKTASTVGKMKDAEKAADIAGKTKDAAKSAEKKEAKPQKEKPSPGKKNMEKIRERNMDKYELKPDEVAKAGSAANDVLKAMDEISREKYGEPLNTAVRKGMKQPEAVRRYFDRHGGAAGLMAADLMDRAGQTIFYADTKEQPQPEVKDRKDTDRLTEDDSYSGFRRNMEREGVDPDYFPDKAMPEGEYEDTGADTFRNLNSVARHGMDIAMRGGDYDEIKRGMREDFEKKQNLGFDMQFRNYTLNKFEMEVKKANE
ncbi:MAG: hypothetical protein IJI14_08130 [Anaerolineaceae bacterium]|nr:hypothetical protein [Anaerolineaceae bacterium]